MAIHSIQHQTRMCRKERGEGFRSAWILLSIFVVGQIGCDGGAGRSPSSSARSTTSSPSSTTPTASISAPDIKTDIAGIVVVRDDGTRVKITADDMDLLVSQIRSFRTSGKTDAEIESASVDLGGHGTISLGEIIKALVSEAKRTESSFEAIKYSSTPGERGYGDVLLSGKVPRKAVARSTKIQIYDEHGFPKREMKPSMPYFVFDDNGEHWLVGLEQDKAAALGWVRADQCYPWPSRRLAYPVALLPKRDPAEGHDSSAPIHTFSAEELMPWPVIVEDRAGRQLTVLADMKGLEGSIVPVQYSTTDELQLFVMFTEREFNQLLARLTETVGFLESGTLKPQQEVKVLGDLLTQNQIDFLDLNEVQAVVDLYPGGKPSFLLDYEIKKRIRKVLPTLRKQLGSLLDVTAVRNFFNPARGVYVLPIGSINKVGEK